MNSYKKMVIYYVASIIYTTLFLISSTYYWFFVRINPYEIYKENFLMSQVIKFDSLEKNSSQSKNLNSYDFSVKNISDTNKDMKICILSLNKNNVSNNYVKYQINNGSVYSLNMDGIIYIDNMEIDESRDINLKIWISDTYSGNLNYNGQVVVI